MHKKFVGLIIMDGYGLAPDHKGNAVNLAKKPFLDELFSTYPTSTLEASGEAVGLPEGQMGNSEVGHLNLGAGRVVYQSLTRINVAIKDGSFYVQDLEIVGKDRYSEEDDGSSTGMPYMLWYDKNAPLGTIRLSPIPSQAYELQLYSHKPFVASTLAITDTLVLPYGYRRALRFNLAREVAPEYGKALSQEASKIARESLRFVKGNNRPTAVLKADVGVSQVMDVETRR